MRVTLHPAERLLNFIVHHTDPYMRRKKGVDENELWNRTFKTLAPFMDETIKAAIAEERESIARWIYEGVDGLNTPEANLVREVAKRIRDRGDKP